MFSSLAPPLLVEAGIAESVDPPGTKYMSKTGVYLVVLIGQVNTPQSTAIEVFHVIPPFIRNKRSKGAKTVKVHSKRQTCELKFKFVGLIYPSILYYSHSRYQANQKIYVYGLFKYIVWSNTLRKNMLQTWRRKLGILGMSDFVKMRYIYIQFTILFTIYFCTYIFHPYHFNNLQKHLTWQLKASQSLICSW